MSITLHMKFWMLGLMSALIIMLALPTMSYAQEAITGSARFYGMAMLDKNGTPVQAEEICAWIHDEEVACGPIQRGRYKIQIDEPAGEEYDGQEIAFTVWIDETETEIEATGFSIWEDGSEQQINLIFPGAIANAVNQARSAIAGFIDPNMSKNMPKLGMPGSSGDEEQRIRQEIEQEKQNRLNDLTQRLQPEIDRIEREKLMNLEIIEQDYKNNVAMLEQGSGNQGEIGQLEWELEDRQNELKRDLGQAPGWRIDEIRRDIERLELNLAQAKQRGNSESQRQIANAQRQYLENKSNQERNATEQISRLKSDLQRERSNIEREMQEQLRQRLSDIERMQGEQERMEREEEMREEQMRMQMEADERRMELEEERMARQMEMEEERMQRDLEMQEDRMRMEQEMMMNNRGQGRNMGQGPGQGPGSDMDSGPPQKRRGFLSNPKPGAKMGTIDNLMDPTMLAVVGIGLTILTTGLTLFRSN